MSEPSVASVEHLPSAVLVRVLAKDLRKKEVDALCSAVDDARLVAPASPFILDMTHVTFAGSMALGVLIGLSQEFRTRNQTLIFANLQKEVRRAVEISNLTRVLEIAPNVPAALSKVRGED